MYGYRQAGGLTADLLLNTKLLSLGEPQQKNAACSTRPTWGLFLGEGEYKRPRIWTSRLQRVELFHLQQLNSTNSGRNECTRFLTFKFWLCTNYHNGQSRNRCSCPLFGLQGHSESCMSPLFGYSHKQTYTKND